MIAGGDGVLSLHGYLDATYEAMASKHVQLMTYIEYQSGHNRKHKVPLAVDGGALNPVLMASNQLPVSPEWAKEG